MSKEELKDFKTNNYITEHGVLTREEKMERDSKIMRMKYKLIELKEILPYFKQRIIEEAKYGGY